MMSDGDIPEKVKKYYEQIIGALEKGVLVVMKGYFNGQERYFLCIEIEDSDHYKIFPRALIIDEDIDSLHDFEKKPMLFEEDIKKERKRRKNNE